MMIALIEDDEAVLHSLQLLLEARGLAVACHRSGESFLAALGAAPLSCVISDIRLPGLSGLDLQRELRQRDAAIPVILITGHGDIAMAVKAIKDGVFDFVEKPFDPDHLVESVERAIQSGLKARSEQSERARLQARMSELSPRQVEVMWLVADGLSNKEIALKLDISPRTVENYRAWVMEKMGAKNLADLVRKALALRNSPPDAL